MTSYWILPSRLSSQNDFVILQQWPGQSHPLIPFFLVWLVRFYSCPLRTSYQSLSTFLDTPESIAEPLLPSLSTVLADTSVRTNLGISSTYRFFFYSFCFNQWDIFAICSSSQFQPLSFLLFKVMLLYFWALFISFLFIVWSVCLGLEGIHVTRGTCGGHRTAWGAGSVHFTLWVSSIKFRLSHLTARALPTELACQPNLPFCPLSYSVYNFPVFRFIL